MSVSNEIKFNNSFVIYILRTTKNLICQPPQYLTNIILSHSVNSLPASLLSDFLGSCVSVPSSSF